MMIEHHEDDGEPRKETLGNLLQRTRRSRHKTVQEAVEDTRINPGAIEALEADDFASLPAEVFTRGFIKLYAKYLGLDPEETLKHYISQENADPEKPADRPYRNDILKGEAMAHAPAFFRGKGRILIVILLLAVLIGFYSLGKFHKPGEGQIGEAVPGNELARSLVEPQAQPEPEVTHSAEEPGPSETRDDNGLKVLEPRATAWKNPGPAEQPELVPVSPEPKSPAQLESQPRAAAETLPKTKPEATPTKPKLPAAVKPAPTEPARPATTSAATAAENGSPRSGSFLPVTVKVATTDPEGSEAESTAAATTTHGPYNYVLEARFRESTKVHVEVDDEPVREYTSQADVTRIWRANHSLILKLDNPEAVELTLNGKSMPLAGEAGKEAIIRIPPDLP